MKASQCIAIFERAIEDYHLEDNVDSNIQNPHQSGSVEALMYLKNWIDTVQWHLEDIIRDPEIHAVNGMKIKRRIDVSNQHRTDTVEHIDDYYIQLFSHVEALPNAVINTESPAWVVDRLSILCLKIYHMAEQVKRKDATYEHLQKCQLKLDILLEQKEDLSKSFDALLNEYADGSKRIKVYRQMKMYNDDSLNPILYKNK